MAYSVAEVERDVMYSRFEGMSRTSLVIRGSGITLCHDHVKVLLRPFEAVAYDGDADWHASLVVGPVTVLNAISIRGLYRVKVNVIVDKITVPKNCIAVVVALDSMSTFQEMTPWAKSSPAIC